MFKTIIYKVIKEYGETAISSSDVVLKHELELPFIASASEEFPFSFQDKGHGFIAIHSEWDNDNKILNLFEENSMVPSGGSISEYVNTLTETTPWKLDSDLEFPEVEEVCGLDEFEIAMLFNHLAASYELKGFFQREDSSLASKLYKGLDSSNAYHSYVINNYRDLIDFLKSEGFIE